MSSLIFDEVQRKDSEVITWRDITISFIATHIHRTRFELPIGSQFSAKGMEGKDEQDVVKGLRCSFRLTGRFTTGELMCDLYQRGHAVVLMHDLAAHQHLYHLHFHEA